MECHVLPALVKATTIITTFDLWMSRTCFDTFVFVINYINKKWQPCHIIMSFFEVHETMGASMVMQLKEVYLLDMSCWTR
jgi:hypothetical protein